MADETLVRGIIQIDVDSGQALSELNALTQQVIQELQSLGRLNTPIGQQLASEFNKGFTSVTQLSDALRRLRAEMVLPDAKASDSRYLNDIRAIDTLKAKTNELAAVERARAATDPITRAEQLAVAARENQAARQIGLSGRPVERAAGRVGDAALKVDEAQAELYRSLRRRVGLSESIAQAEEARRATLARLAPLEAIEAKGRSGQAITTREFRDVQAIGDVRSQLSKEDAQIASLKKQHEASMRQVVTQAERVIQAEARVANASTTLGEVKERAAAREIGRQGKASAAEARQLAAEEKAARAAEEKASALADPRLERIRQGQDQFLDGSGIDQTKSLRMQALLLEQQVLQKTREELIAKTQTVESEKDVARLSAQKESLEKRILSNTAAINQQGLKDQGKGGFWGGVMGGFGGQRAQGMEEISFQAGQSVKYFAMYQALSLVQNGMQTLIQTAIELSQAQVDLAVTMGRATEEVSGQMAEYARLGRQYATGPVEASRGANTFLRTFRNEDGTVREDSGRQGALLGSILNVLEGQEKIETTQADLIALAKAYGTGAAGTSSYYDMATFIAREFGVGASGGEILSGTAAIGALGKDLGYSVPDLMAIIAGVMQQTGVSGDAAAGDIKRFMGEAEAPAMNEMFREFGISLDLTFKERMDRLYEEMKGMTRDERTNVLNAAGDARTAAAVAAYLSSMDVAQRIGARVDDEAPGSASSLAKQQLQGLAGSVKELNRELVQVAGALANAGFGPMLTTVVQTTTSVIQSLTMFGDVLGLLPGPMKEFLAFLVASAAIGKAGAAAKGALAGSEFMAGFAGSRLGAGASAAAGVGAANVDNLMRARVLARAGGDAAEVALLTKQIDIARKANAGLTTGVGRLAGGLGHATKVLGPFVAAVGALALIGESYDLDQRRKNAGDTQVAAGKTYDEARATGDVEGMRAALGEMETAKQELAGTREGFTSWLTNIISGAGISEDWQRGVEGASLWQTDHGKVREQEAELDRIIAEGEAEIVALMAKYEAMLAGTVSPEWFGPGYAKAAFGVQQITENGLGVDPSIEAFRDLTMNDPRLNRVLAPEGGASDLYEHIAKQIGRLNNPLEQEAGMQEMLDALRDLQARTSVSGTSMQKDMVASLVEEAGREYNDLVVSNVQKKIENIKAFQDESPGALNQIKGELTKAMHGVAATGDVESLAALMSSADAAFLEAHRANLLVMITELENQMKVLAAARQASMDLANAARQFGEEGLRSEFAAEARQKGDQLDYSSDSLAEMRKRLETFDVAKTLSAPKGSAFDWGGGSGPSAEDIELSRIRAQAISGDPVSEAKASLRAAEYQLRNAENQQEYWDGVKAVNDAKHSLAQAQLDASTAAIAESARAGDPLSQARANVRIAEAQLRGAVGASARSQAMQGLEEARLAYSRAQLDVSLAAIAAAVIPGDPLSAAKANFETAQRQLKAAVGGVEYYNALKSLRDAQYELGQLSLERAQNTRLLAIDITDPVAQANAEVEAAKRQMAFNKNRGASQDVQLADQVALRQAQTNAQQTAWDQQFSDAQTNYNLQRTSLSAYLNYLNSQREYLSAVQNKTRAQIEQLNQVDSALKSIADGMNGQWNLGDIDIPSPYEVRRSLAAQSSYTSGSTTYVDIRIDGANMLEVQNLLADYLGRGTIQAAATLPPR